MEAQDYWYQLFLFLHILLFGQNLHSFFGIYYICFHLGCLDQNHPSSAAVFSTVKK